ncbi:LAMI_0H08988g1_1 [Lachancea mirantina]|uniref:LAMI_0H08988g1_1 n=1 Tax=Lachancea mirantina TaxID=1230905 RepID=A0A1G4KG70_9SACH|nr:LAMI_0H08988g1_1 [Lachancea mirantina]
MRLNDTSGDDLAGLLSKYVHSYADLDESSSLVLLKFDGTENTYDDHVHNLTSKLLAHFLNSARTGSAHRHVGISPKAFLSSVLLALIVWIFQLFAFTLLRRKMPRIYHIGRYLEELLSEKPLKRQPPYFEWITCTWKMPLSHFKDSAGLDVFFFLRFLKVLAVFFFSIAIVNNPILIPVHWSSGPNEMTAQTIKPEFFSNFTRQDANFTTFKDARALPPSHGLDKLSMSNIAPQHSKRLILHFVLSIFVIIWFHIMLLSELEFYVRQKNVTWSKRTSPSVRFHEVLYVENVPAAWIEDHSNLFNYFHGIVPDCIDHICFVPRVVQKCKRYEAKVQKILNKVESLLAAAEAEVAISEGDPQKRIANSRDPASLPEAAPFQHRTPSTLHSPRAQRTTSFSREPEDQKQLEFALSVQRFGKRCRHIYRIKNITATTKSLKFRCLRKEVKVNLFKNHVIALTLLWPILYLSSRKYCYLLNKQIDTLLKNYRKTCSDWDRLEITNCFRPHTYGTLRSNEDIRNIGSQRIPQSSKTIYGKVFIQFKECNTANLFSEILLPEKAPRVTDKILGINPQDILWRNLTCSNWFWVFFRVCISNAISVIITVGWAIPIAFVGLVSQIQYAVALVPHLNWLNPENSIISAATSNLLPILTLIFLTEFAPWIFRQLSVLKGRRTGAEIERDIEQWLFVFFFIHIFLVVTISSGVPIMIEKILYDPSGIPKLLASNLPKSANFFYSFILIRGLANSGGNLLKISELISDAVYYRFNDDTPRKQRERALKLTVFNTASRFSLFSTLASVTIVYSVIAPLILPLACATFALLFFSFKCSLEGMGFCLNASDTMGMLYPQALLQLYAGIYCLEICLVGLFALSAEYRLSVGMLVMLLCTAIAHVHILTIYNKRIQHMPIQPFKSGEKNETDIFKTPRFWRLDWTQMNLDSTVEGLV